MDDFFRPKIVWKRIGSIIRFCYDESQLVTLDSTCFASGSNLKYLVAILNSKMGEYLLKDSPKTGTGDLLISVQAVEPIPIPIISIDQEIQFNMLVDKILSQYPGNYESEETKINNLIYKLYNLNENEIDVIENSQFIDFQ